MSGCVDFTGDVLAPYGNFRDVFQIPGTLQKVPLGWTNCSWFCYATIASQWTASDAPCLADKLTCVDSPPYSLGRFAFLNAAYQIRRVVDTSGPAGLEDEIAAQLDFSGIGGEGMTFIGAGMDDTPGISIAFGQCWQVDFWAKAVADPWTGFVASGYDIHARLGSAPVFFGEGGAGDSMSPSTLSSSWQHFTAQIVINVTVSGDPNNATFGLYTDSNNTTGGIHTKKGSMLVKCLKLYPCNERPLQNYGVRRAGVTRPGMEVA